MVYTADDTTCFLPLRLVFWANLTWGLDRYDTRTGTTTATLSLRRTSSNVDDPVSTPDASSSQLFQCAGVELGDSLLKTDPSIVSKPTSVVTAVTKSLAIIVVATGVMRAELVRMPQDRVESFRAFAARVRGKAETCAYITKCTCLREVDFTDSIIRDVLIAGIADLAIRREVLGTNAILESAVDDVTSLVKSKEMARNALPSSASGIYHPPSSDADRYQQHNRLPLIDIRLRYIYMSRLQTNMCTLLGGSAHVGTPDHTVNA